MTFFDCFRLILTKFLNNFESRGYCMKMRSCLRKSRNLDKTGNQSQNSFKVITKLIAETDMQNSQMNIWSDYGLKMKLKFWTNTMASTELTMQSLQRNYQEGQPSKLKTVSVISIERRKDTRFQMMMINDWSHWWINSNQTLVKSKNWDFRSTPSKYLKRGCRLSQVESQIPLFRQMMSVLLVKVKGLAAKTLVKLSLLTRLNHNSSMTMLNSLKRTSQWLTLKHLQEQNSRHSLQRKNFLSKSSPLLKPSLMTSSHSLETKWKKQEAKGLK